MAALEELKEIYSRYATRLDKEIKAASAFAGAFNMGDDPRKHACNEVFYEDVEAWTEEFAAGQPCGAETAEAVRWILEAAGDRRAPTFWYCYAAQKHALKLIPMLDQADAAGIQEQFRSRYPKLDWLPVQVQVDKALSGRSGRGAAGNETFRDYLKKIIKK